MAYGLNPALFLEDGPALNAARSAAARRSSSQYLAWRSLDPERRLALVDQALAPHSNSNSPDGNSLAL
jgi:hypothetical protein